MWVIITTCLRISEESSSLVFLNLTLLLSYHHFLFTIWAIQFFRSILPVGGFFLYFEAFAEDNCFDLDKWS